MPINRVQSYKWLAAWESNETPVTLESRSNMWPHQPLPSGQPGSTDDELLFFSNLDITDWLSCFFKLHYFHLQKKKYFKYWDFPKYLLTSACYNTSNFLYLRTTISWLCTLCTWDEKIHWTVIIYDYMYTCASGWRVMCTCMKTPQWSKELDGLDLSNRRL